MDEPNETITLTYHASHGQPEHKVTYNHTFLSLLIIERYLLVDWSVIGRSCWQR